MRSSCQKKNSVIKFDNFNYHESFIFFFRYNCILDTLDAIYDDRKDPEVYGIRVSATNKSLLAGTVLLCDILRPVNMLSLYLQQEDINFTTLPIRVKETTDLLHQLIEKYNRNQLDDTEYDKVNGMFLEVDDRTTLARRMRACANRITPESFIEQTGEAILFSNSPLKTSIHHLVHSLYKNVS